MSAVHLRDALTPHIKLLYGVQDPSIIAHQPLLLQPSIHLRRGTGHAEGCAWEVGKRCSWNSRALPWRAGLRCRGVDWAFELIAIYSLTTTTISNFWAHHNFRTYQSDS